MMALIVLSYGLCIAYSASKVSFLFYQQTLCASNRNDPNEILVMNDDQVADDIDFKSIQSFVLKIRLRPIFPHRQLGFAKSTRDTKKKAKPRPSSSLIKLIEYNV